MSQIELMKLNHGTQATQLVRQRSKGFHWIQRSWPAGSACCYVEIAAFMALGLIKIEGRMDGADMSAKVESVSLKYASFTETNGLSAKLTVHFS